MLRIGELVEPSINGSFDFAQGSWAKAVVFLGVEGRVTFAPRIAGAILERWSRDRALRLRSGVLGCLGSVSLSNRRSMGPSTSLRDPVFLRSGSLSFCAQGALCCSENIIRRSDQNLPWDVRIEGMKNPAAVSHLRIHDRISCISIPLFFRLLSFVNFWVLFCSGNRHR